MRPILLPLALAALLLAPTASTLGITRAPIPTPEQFDVSDAQLLRLLNPTLTLRPTAELYALIDHEATLAELIARIATRGGGDLGEDDIAPFLKLDPSIQAPTRLALATIDAAWVLRHQAFAGLSPEEERELVALMLDGKLDRPRGVALVSQTDKQALLEGAILLLDMLDTTIVPMLKEAAQSPAWPATMVADPVGILRIGGTGNDLDTLNRVLQIDPRGDDTHRNNAGGTNVGELLTRPTDLRYQVAVSIDLAGNDFYDKFATIEAQGGGAFGIGILLDLDGDDLYRCRTRCQGAGSLGVGYFRDYAGNDETITSGGQSKGYADGGYGIYRDDSDDDTHYCGGRCGGYGAGDGAIGLFWDRQGTDSHSTNGDIGSLGWAINAGRGWFVDEGEETDYYETATLPGPDAHGCNTCTWSGGIRAVGYGNDNYGGLPYLMTRQDNI